MSLILLGPKGEHYVTDEPLVGCSAGCYVLKVVYVEDKAGSVGSENFDRYTSRCHALVCAVRRATMACTLATRCTADDFPPDAQLGSAAKEEVISAGRLLCGMRSDV